VKVNLFARHDDAAQIGHFKGALAYASESTPRQIRKVRPGNHGDNTRPRGGLGEVNPFNMRMSVWAAQDFPIKHAGEHQVCPKLGNAAHFVQPIHLAGRPS
jgi:hypothetical protein